ncbi:MAG: hypothetical protein QHC90_20935 [Shinella sp.]|jgi:DNA-binding response OmpR family regulator|nr:hypothetical protein [Shinella sp.]
MNSIIPHIVIVEGEFLIALEAEFFIKNAIESRISLVRMEQLDEWSDEALKTATLCLLDVPLDPSAVLLRARRLADLGVSVLFTTVSEEYRHGVAGFETIPVITKPYDGDALVRTIRSLLSVDEPSRQASP